MTDEQPCYVCETPTTRRYGFGEIVQEPLCSDECIAEYKEGVHLAMKVRAEQLANRDGL